MLRRSRDLFRWARERRPQADRFAEGSMFHQLSKQWAAVTPRMASADAPTRKRKPALPLFWREMARPVPQRK